MKIICLIIGVFFTGMAYCQLRVNKGEKIKGIGILELGKTSAEILASLKAEHVDITADLPAGVPATKCNETSRYFVPLYNIDGSDLKKILLIFYHDSLISIRAVSKNLDEVEDFKWYFLKKYKQDIYWDDYRKSDKCGGEFDQDYDENYRWTSNIPNVSISYSYYDECDIDDTPGKKIYKKESNTFSIKNDSAGDDCARY